jgi:DNA-binding GntR family transcriptional regulator
MPRAPRGDKPQITSIADALRREILRGTLSIGDLTPTESQLATQHNVHRITAGRALAILVEEDLLVQVRGYGYRVRVSPAAACLFEVRAAVAARCYPRPDQVRALIELVINLWQDRRHPYICAEADR